MNSKEKFLAVMNFERDTPILKAEFGYWAGTIRNWFKEGLKKIEDIPEQMSDSQLIRGSKPFSESYNTLTDKNVMEYFNFDSYLEKIPIDYSPMFKEKILIDEKDYKVLIDNYGITRKVFKKIASTPMVINYPIKNKKDFYNYISNYNSDLTKRLPRNFYNISEKLKERDFPIRLGGNPFGFSFLARHLMGEVTFMLSLYDDPILLKDFNEYFLNFTMNYWSKILEKIDVDCIFILEDIAYRSGSFISREMFKEYMSPYYIRLIDFLKQYRITNIFVDCDGLIEELIPLWIEVGVTGLFPLEAVNDIMKIRQHYPKLKLLGGFNKKVLFKNSTKEKIDEELDRISGIIRQGGYIPHIDHAVSEDVTWENFKYYRTRLNSIIDAL